VKVIGARASTDMMNLTMIYEVRGKRGRRGAVPAMRLLDTGLMTAHEGGHQKAFWSCIGNRASISCVLCAGSDGSLLALDHGWDRADSLPEVDVSGDASSMSAVHSGGFSSSAERGIAKFRAHMGLQKPFKHRQVWIGRSSLSNMKTNGLIRALRAHFASTSLLS
jgi:hypothetical protein